MKTAVVGTFTSLPPSLPPSRFDPKLLFQLTCSDMVERFKLLLFLVLITLLNLGQHAKEEGGGGVLYGARGGREGRRAREEERNRLCHGGREGKKARKRKKLRRHARNYGVMLTLSISASVFSSHLH